MKKWFLLLIGIVVIIIGVFLILSNGFSNTESIKVQKLDRETNQFDEGIIIRDSSKLKTFKKILNGANHERNISYEMAYREDFRVTLTFEDDTTDVLNVWKKSGDSTFIILYTKNEAFRIKNESHQKEFLEILNSKVDF
ncbi:hypothetical protein JFL43_09475 [Viridibacillus sp. YIM B01967]|uniref:YhfM-like domain-containing protein n=1 Tax=Viridibacillus soli TaxID=2798301 RepID=A0ABS1H6N6_9BACL|nr:hypothetical protein [Viridibacillus soli]MBK3495082.1 hypothetical protein [Viridibacillus soli]